MNDKRVINDKKDIVEFIEWALNHQVDYVYVLEDLIKMLKWTKREWSPEDYID